MQKDNWALIATFKKNESTLQSFRLLESFIEFYKREWGIKKFVLLIGIAQGLDKKDIVGRINKYDDSFRETIYFPFNYTFLKNAIYFRSKKEENISVDCLFYDTNAGSTWQEWNNVKNMIFSATNDSLDKKYNKVVNIDNDEFLFVPDKRLLNKSEMHFHYIEYIPGDIFDLKNDMRWSLQPWYERKRYNGKNLNVLTHGACKKFWFDRKSILEPWNHKKGGHICSLIGDDVNINVSEAKKILNENYFAYHISTLDKEHFMKSKGIKFSKRAFYKEQDQFKTRMQLEDFWKNYCIDVEYPIIVDNRMKEYFK